jgi:CheY-like chemotaxis protein
VDDDEIFLDMLMSVLPAEWNILLYSQPLPAIAHVQASSQRLDHDAGLQQAIANRFVEQPVVPELLRYLANSPDRFDIVGTVVCDYLMPHMNGLKLFQKIGTWGGSRILLTGQADETIAIKALNAHPARLIEQYTPKTTGQGTLADSLISMITDLSVKAHPRYAQIWRGLLSEAQFALLQDPQTVADLTELADRYWVEYFVIGQPFGILGVSAAGIPSWLQLEPAGSLRLAAEIAADAGCSRDEVQQVAAGAAVAAVELLGKSERRVAPAMKLGGGKLLASHFTPWPALAKGGWDAWRAAQPGRVIADA